jgi:2-polyprenyl-3-methyl-5-hydroxy-6-metoxy-1,4-benzoquinol methylase
MTRAVQHDADGSSIERQEEYYTNRWKGFGYANRLELARMMKVLQLMTEIDLPSRPKICDLGCGAGWSTSVLGIFGEATGVDLSDVGSAQSRFGHCKFRTADVLKWDDAPRAEYDLVVSMEVIEHVDGAAQLEYLTVVRRILKPNGYLILTTPNKDTMDAILGGGRTWSNQPVENWLDAKHLKSLLLRSEFEIKLMTSFLLGIGTLGWYGLVNSYKVNQLLHCFGADRLWRQAAGRANYGLHFAVLARAKNPHEDRPGASSRL